jgi:membrane-bound metal-dependent hydrolase YbcI (DUF457 family)
MDLFNHAIAGASVGLAFGNPWLGAFMGVAPDLVLGPRRRRLPTGAYNATHSIITTTILGLPIWIIFKTPIPLLALYSHLLLDLFTHGKVWAPPLFYPLSNRRYTFNQEWEWFNESWFLGLFITIAWSSAWLELVYLTGFR